MAPPTNTTLHNHNHRLTRTRSTKNKAKPAGQNSTQPLPPPMFDFGGLATTQKSDSSSIQQSGSSWSFNSSTRLASLLASSSSSSTLLGIRPLSPPPGPQRRSAPASNQASRLYTHQNHNELTISEALGGCDANAIAVHYSTSQMNGKRQGRKRRVRNLAEYFPFVEAYQEGVSGKSNYRSLKRGRRGGNGGVDYFAVLPDEMVLRVLKNLSKPSLGRVALVNKRLSRLIRDESLWSKIDCAGASLGEGQLSVICKRRPDYLRLARTEITTCSLPTAPTLPLPLTHLDLTMALIHPSTLVNLLGKCPKLENLSLESCSLDGSVFKVMKVMQKSIKVLNLSMCYDVGAGELAALLRGCAGLTQLNLSCISQDSLNEKNESKWTEADLMTVVASLPNQLSQLNMSGFRYLMKDAHTSLLATRLPSLIELDISDSQELTGATLQHLTGLKLLQHLSLSRCYSIEPAAYAILATIKSLRYLELFSLFKLSSINSLGNSLLKGIEINQFPFSAIARPTVGNRRSTIWGVRVRE